MQEEPQEENTSNVLETIYNRSVLWWQLGRRVREVKVYKQCNVLTSNT